MKVLRPGIEHLVASDVRAAKWILALLERRFATNPHVRFANSQRGYLLTRFDATSARADFRVVPYVDRPGAPIATRASFTVSAGEVGLHRA